MKVTRRFPSNWNSGWRRWRWGEGDGGGGRERGCSFRSICLLFLSFSTIPTSFPSCSNNPNTASKNILSEAGVGRDLSVCADYLCRLLVSPASSLNLSSPPTPANSLHSLSAFLPLSTPYPTPIGPLDTPGFTKRTLQWILILEDPSCIR